MNFEFLLRPKIYKYPIIIPIVYSSLYLTKNVNKGEFFLALDPPLYITCNCLSRKCSGSQTIYGIFLQGDMTSNYRNEKNTAGHPSVHAYPRPITKFTFRSL